MQHQATMQANPERAYAAVSKPLRIAGAVLLAAVMLFGVGFAPAPALRNAAHDARHAQGFPCH